MKTYFIQNDSESLRNFLMSKQINIVTTYENMTGIVLRDDQQLFFVGLQYGEYLHKINNNL